ncbi:hypothetical protein [Stenotrophomonas forensis]|uniref:hypothetical protein n=1 Tax=Stenotrophomonas forensis TaxID=2871169 RepID=UPI0039C6B028
MFDALWLIVVAVGIVVICLVRVIELVHAWREHTAAQPDREAHFAANAIAELHRMEIASTKRGNLLAAAELAEEQERAA